MSNPFQSPQPQEVLLPPVLQASGLHRYLGQGESRTHALRGADISLAAGQSCAIVGPSGCGKSTLLYLLGLLDRADAGQISIGGQSLAGASDALRTQTRNSSIGFVFQFHYLLPEFTALENVMLPMDKLGTLAPAQRRARAQELLDSVGLAHRAGRLAGNLSGGEQQRVAVARALANAPALILADEPTGNLDRANSEKVFSLLRGSARMHGHAVLMVTHNAELAAEADRCLHMEDGCFV